MTSDQSAALKLWQLPVGEAETWVKICGITRPDDVISSIRAGANAVGFNGYRHSKRYLEFSKALSWIADFKDQILRVAVLVNEDRAEIQRVWDTGCFDLIQLHGDETWSDVSSFVQIGIPILKAVRIPPEISNIPAIPCISGVKQTVLLDAMSPQTYGGSGESLNWPLIGNWQRKHHNPFILAGGLRPENVAEAIQSSHCSGVDVAGGVEVSAGIKSASFIEKFVKNARLAKSYSQRA